MGRLIIPVAHIVTLVIPLINLLTKSHDPPSRGPDSRTPESMQCLVGLHVNFGLRFRVAVKELKLSYHNGYIYIK